jgi:hypothetical protein
MGMFDTLKVQLKIPGFSDIPDCEFQTKSLDSAMENYVITDNGELYKEVWDYEWTDDPSSTFNGYFNKVEGSYRREYLTNYHGDIIFYTGETIDEKWRDYTARFTEGRLSRIWYEDKQY